MLITNSGNGKMHAYHDAMTQNPQTFRFPLQLRHKE